MCHICFKKPMKKLLIVLILAFHVMNTDAQHLKRRGSIGIQPAPVDQAAATSAGLASPKGAVVKEVLPGSTAARVGMQVNDIILRINDKEIGSLPHLLQIAHALKSEETISFTVVRNKKEMVLKGKVQPRPLNKTSAGETIYDEVGFESGFLRAIVNKPAGEGPFPVIYLMQGYTCASVDDMAPFDPYRKLFDQLVSEGFVVFRVEKPGVGDSFNTGSCDTLGFKREVAAFDKAYEKLTSYSFIDKDAIFLLGHSMGGAVAPLVARNHSPRGVITYGTLLRPPFEYFISAMRTQHPLMGADYVETDKHLRIYYRFLYEYLIEKKPMEQLVSNNNYLPFVMKDLQTGRKDQYEHRHYTFWQDLQDMPLAEAWKDTKAQVLTIYGEADIEAIGPDDSILITDLVNYYRPGTASYKYMENVNHSMIRFEDKKTDLRLRGQPAYAAHMDKNYDDRVVKEIVEWARKVMEQ